MSDADRVAQALRTKNIRGRAWIRVPCPFCADEGHKDTKASLAVNAASGFYVCWRCDTRGSLPEPPDPDQAAITEWKEHHEPATMEAPPYFQDLGDETLIWPDMARAYLRKRRISQTAIREAHVGIIDAVAIREACNSAETLMGYKYDANQISTAADEDFQTTKGLRKFAWSWMNRVIVPHLHEDGKRWHGWFGRSILPSEKRMKHLYPKGMSRDLLWNYRLLNDETTDQPVFAVEGCLDALYLWPDAVAFMGSPAKAHEAALLNSKRPVVVVLDGDAWEKGQMLALKLKFNGQRAGHIRLPPKADPDEMGIDFLYDQARKALI